MRTGVLVFPGSNCDRDVIVALKVLSKLSPIKIWHKETTIPNLDLIIIPGGFSFGDYLRCGAIAAKSPIINALKNHASRGGAILGICNGFQILIETGLLPGSLRRNKNLKFICKEISLIVQKSIISPFTSGLICKSKISLPIAHNEGNFFANDSLIKSLEDKNLIAFKYCDELGNVNNESNPNGSSNNIAGILNNEKNILGIMPHPERLIDSFLSGEDGSMMFKSLSKKN